MLKAVDDVDEGDRSLKKKKKETSKNNCFKKCSSRGNVGMCGTGVEKRDRFIPLIGKGKKDVERYFLR